MKEKAYFIKAVIMQLRSNMSELMLIRCWRTLLENGLNPNILDSLSVPEIMRVILIALLSTSVVLASKNVEGRQGEILHQVKKTDFTIEHISISPVQLNKIFEKFSNLVFH